MISVCIATYNGESFIQEQVKSILKQLLADDEIIISDDNSNDETLKLVKDLNDKRIKVYHNKSKGYTSNFINALNQSTGDYIFIADQDDIWLPRKVEITLDYLTNKNYQMVISDCFVVDKDLNIISESYFQTRKTNSGLLQTIIKSGYLGCCMAFNRQVYMRAVPFPSKYKFMPYDLWLGLIGYAFFKVATIEDKLILYRRHGNNASDGGVSSNKSFVFKVSYRVYAIYQLLSNFIRLLRR